MEKEFKEEERIVPVKIQDIEFDDLIEEEEKEVKSLSEKIRYMYDKDVLLAEDIKKFIKKIEEIVLNPKTTLIRKVGQIRAKAGPKLITKS